MAAWAADSGWPHSAPRGHPPPVGLRPAHRDSNPKSGSLTAVAYPEPRSTSQVYRRVRPLLPNRLELLSPRHAAGGAPVVAHRADPSGESGVHALPEHVTGRRSQAGGDAGVTVGVIDTLRERGIGPSELWCDTSYGSGHNGWEAERRGGRSW